MLGVAIATSFSTKTFPPGIKLLHGPDGAVIKYMQPPHSISLLSVFIATYRGALSNPPQLGPFSML